LTGDLPFGVIQAPAFVRKDSRGTFEEILNVGRWESLICGSMDKGAAMGHHYHAHTVVFFYLLEGSSHIITVDVPSNHRNEFTIRAGQGFLFRPSEARVITHLEPVRFLMMKSHRFDPKAPDLIEYRVT